MGRTFLPFLALLFIAASTRAQDLTTRWKDRIIHELQQDRGPLKPADETIYQLGGMYAYDSNIFLDESGKEDPDTILAGFVRARGTHSESLWDATIDVMATYRQFMQDSSQSRDVEHIFVSGRYAGSAIDLQVAEIFRHESAPIDAVFAERIERNISDTLFTAKVHVMDELSLEWGSTLQVVRFLDEDFEKSDNESIRTDLSAVYRTSAGYAIVGQGGYHKIHYRYETGAPPDVEGAYYRIGFRGNIYPTVNAQVLVGVANIETDKFPDGSKDELETGDVATYLQWEATPELVFHFDYTRTIGFGGPLDPYQVINRVILSGELDLTEQLTVRARLQHDDVHSSLGVERTFLSVGGSFTWKYTEDAAIDAGVVHRSGEVHLGPEYDDVIIFAGIVFSN